MLRRFLSSPKRKEGKNMKEKSNELKAILNEIAREENLNRYVIPALRKPTLDNIKDIINACFRKYKTFDDVTRRLWRAINRMDKIETDKFDELETDRLCDFKYFLREMKDKYIHIVKEPVPILVMELIDFQIPEFMNEIKYSNEEIAKLRRGDLIIIAREAKEKTIVKITDFENVDYYEEFMKELNAIIGKFLKDKQHSMIAIKYDPFLVRW